METITKRDLIQEASDKTGLTNKAATEVLDCLLNRIGASLAEGNKVVIREFGTFEPRVKREKLAHNPKNPEEKVIIPTSSVVKFKPGKTLKQKAAVALPTLLKRG